MVFIPKTNKINLRSTKVMERMVVSDNPPKKVKPTIRNKKDWDKLIKQARKNNYGNTPEAFQ